MSGRAPHSFTIDKRKLTDYLLNPLHKDGGPKARFFVKLGFSTSDPNVLARALLSHAQPERYVRAQSTPWGDRLIFEGSLDAPNGRPFRIRTIWQVKPDDPAEAVFVTAIPMPS